MQQKRCLIHVIRNGSIVVRLFGSGKIIMILHYYIHDEKPANLLFKNSFVKENITLEMRLEAPQINSRKICQFCSSEKS